MVASNRLESPEGLLTWFVLLWFMVQTLVTVDDRVSVVSLGGNIKANGVEQNEYSTLYGTQILGSNGILTRNQLFQHYDQIL